MCATGYLQSHCALVAPQAKQTHNKKKHARELLFAMCLIDVA